MWRGPSEYIVARRVPTSWIVVDISYRTIELDAAIKEIERVAAVRCRPGMNVIIKDHDRLIKWITKIDA